MKSILNASKATLSEEKSEDEMIEQQADNKSLTESCMSTCDRVPTTLRSVFDRSTLSVESIPLAESTIVSRSSLPGPSRIQNEKSLQPEDLSALIEETTDEHVDRFQEGNASDNSDLNNEKISPRAPHRTQKGK